MHTNKKRFISVLLSGVMMLALVTGCSSSSSSTPTPAPTESSASSSSSSTATDTTSEPAYKELTLYTAMPEAENPYYISAFEADTGIKVNYVRLSTGEMISRIEAEAANPQVSLIMGGSADNCIAAYNMGLLEPYQSPELVNVPEAYCDPDGVWNPIYVGAMSFACNSDWFTANGLDYPTSWADLLKPEFADQISMPHPTTSGTAYLTLSTLVQMMGEDEAFAYFEQLNDSVRQYTKSGSAPATQVALGEAAIGILFSHDALKPANEGYPVELSFPADGTGYEIGAIALVKDGPEEEVENAKAFIDWFVSARGQECFIESQSNRSPVNTTAKVSDGLVSLDDLEVIDYDFVWSGNNRTALLERFSEEIDNGQTAE